MLESLLQQQWTNYRDGIEHCWGAWEFSEKQKSWWGGGGLTEKHKGLELEQFGYSQEGDSGLIMLAVHPLLTLL